jgi:hypothetical protein
MEEGLKTYIASAITALFFLPAVFAIDAFDVKPGLWEISVNTNIPGMPNMSQMPKIPAMPPEIMAKLPPAQRAQMESMMKGRGGASSPMSSRICMTRNSMDNGGFGQTDKSCKSKIVSSTANKQVLQMECTQDGAKMTGELTLERVDSEHVKGSAVMKSPQGQMKMSFNNRWISNDCGDVKPTEQPDR